MLMIHLGLLCIYTVQHSVCHPARMEGDVQLHSSATVLINGQEEAVKLVSCCKYIHLWNVQKYGFSLLLTFIPQISMNVI